MKGYIMRIFISLQLLPVGQRPTVTHKFLISLIYCTGLEAILALLEVHNDRKHHALILGTNRNVAGVEEPQS